MATKVTYEEASLQCKDLGTYSILAGVTDKIRDFIFTLGVGDPLWLGSQMSPKAVLKWVEGNGPADNG